VTGTGFGKRMDPEAYWDLAHIYAIEAGVTDGGPCDIVREIATDIVRFFPVDTVPDREDEEAFKRVFGPAARPANVRWWTE